MADGYVGKVVGPFGEGAFLRSKQDKLELHQGQWGMIEPKAQTRRPSSKAILTNNARTETVAERKTYKAAWRKKQRCLIPTAWYLEPNWETSKVKSMPWHLRRADGLPWALAGLWSAWVDPVSGELVPSYTLLTMNCDAHPLLNRLHKPDDHLPADQQDKRAVIHVQPKDWEAWLWGSEGDAKALCKLPEVDFFDLTDARRTDEMLVKGTEPAIDPNLSLF